MKILSIDEKYEAELKKADLDHHKPTAGAMVGHVLSNLFIEQTKLLQASLYAKKRTNKAIFEQLEKDEHHYFVALSATLLDVDEVIPTTTDEFVRYAKFVDESAKFKYKTDEMRIENLIQDFIHQNLFVTRAIKLARKEEKFPLEQALISLLSFNQGTIRLLAGDLEKDLKEFYDEDEEDD